MSNRSFAAQQKRIEETLEEMHLWYICENNGQPAESVAEDKKTYRGKVLRWLEPILPGKENPVLIEEQLGDYWTLRMEPMTKKLVGS